MRNFRRAVNEISVLSERVNGKFLVRNKVKAKRLLLWCASVGEVRSIITLIDYLRDYDLVIAVGTASGYQQASRLFAGRDYVSVVYSPLDFPFSVSRFLTKIMPDAVLIVETEIWPNLIWIARRQGRPLILINGRFSRRSRRLFLLFRSLIVQLLNNFSLLLLRSETDRNNLTLTGLKVPIEVTGNMKYDLGGTIDVGRAISQRSQLFKSQDLVIVAGSIRPGEEKIIIVAYQQVREQIRQPLKLLIAPRHQEMIAAIEKYLGENNFSSARWSQIDHSQPVTVDCLVIDTVGDLFNLYGLAQVAIIGGSFLDYGGQNPLEPAAWGCPVIFGKYMSNFAEEANALLKKGGGFLASDFSRLMENLIALLNDRQKRIIAGENARKTQQELSGATEKNFTRIKELL